MGDIGGVEANGVVAEERLVYNNPDPSSITDDYWALAEEAIQEVVNCVHPTLDSEEKRKDVIEYVQRLIRYSLGLEVFTYGSVPLKTYLPDGDIDLTVLSSPCVEGSWASDVLSVLKGEEQNENAEYQVKDTQFIDAEVKLVKCLVQNIVIDISFNQLGGLCTLCFLEQVDRLVGKNHLFKRSIILVKTWCYYESRILGAHHGLISTYALETLVLYIFHLYHTSFNGPLAVLYRFLDYFSKFDWENYCISLNGPVCKASLPRIVFQMPKNEGNDLLLSEEFLRNCMEMFSVPSRGSETTIRAFPSKHLNIFDPLKDYNNLGRSVHRGNFYRIRSAFKYGARKLGRILSLPRDEIAVEIKKFFSNTLQRHGCKNLSGSQDYAQSGAEGSGKLYSLSSTEDFSEDDLLLKSSTGDFENEGLLIEEKYMSVESDRCSMKEGPPKMTSELGYCMEGALSSYHVTGEAYDTAIYSCLDFRTSNCTSDCSPSSNYTGYFFGQYYPVPQFYVPMSSSEVGHFYQTGPSDAVREKLQPNPWLEHRENHLDMVNTYQSCEDTLDNFCSCSSAVSSPKTSTLESLSLDLRERESASVVDAEPLNPLADLSGDYDSHIRSLLYGQCCHGFALSAPVLSNSPSMSSRIGLKKPGDSVHQSMPHRLTSSSEVNSDTVFMGPPANVAPSCSLFTSEEEHKARGTDPYLPTKNSFCRDRPSQGRSRNKLSDTHGQLPRHPHSNGFLPSFSERDSSGKGFREVLQMWCPVQSHEKSGEVRQSYHHSSEGDTHANGFSKSPCKIEFGSLGQLGDDLFCGSLIAGGSTPSASLDKRTSDFSEREERVADQSFHLKNEDEFPPLSL